MQRLGTLVISILGMFCALGASAQFLPGMAFSGSDERIYALEIFDDGGGPALYATGRIVNGDGNFVNSIGKWTGTTWEPLQFGIGNPLTGSSWVGWSLAVHDDGNGEALYVGGNFFQASGIPANHIARWDGDNWSALGEGMKGTVTRLASYDDGNGSALYATGAFAGIWKWDGTDWESLPGAGSGGSMVVYDDGDGEKLYVAGSVEVDGELTNGISAWDGTTWHKLEGLSGIDGVADGFVWAMAAYDDGNGEKLYVGGTFQSAGGIDSPYLAAWNGTTWQAVPGLPLDDEVRALIVHDGGNGPRLVAAINVINEPNLVVAWDGRTWTELDSPGRLARGSVLDFAVLDEPTGQRLFAGGTFFRSGVVNKTQYIAQWDGQEWTNVGGADLLGLDFTVSAFEVYDDGDGEALYLGGEFNSAGNAYAKSVARYDGTSFSGLLDPSGDGIVLPESGFDVDVYTLRAFDDGSGAGNRLFAGGRFVREGETPLQYLAAWDGTSWQPVGGELNGWVEDLTVFDDGSGAALYVGGRFTTAGGVTVNRLAKWNGTSFEPVGDGTVGTDGTVWESIAFDDGFGPALYVTGFFFESGGVVEGRLSRWDAKDGWTSVGGFDIGGSSFVTSLEIFDDGSGPALYIAGDFPQVNGIEANGIIKWDGLDFSTLSGPEGIGLKEDGGSPTIYDMVAYDAGAGERLYVVGEFDTAGGRTVYNVASWDGTTWRPLIGQEPLIYEITFGGGVPRATEIFGYDDGEPTLFISGNFTTIGGVSSHFLSRYRDNVSIFTDGFESGDVSSWSSAAGTP